MGSRILRDVIVTSGTTDAFRASYNAVAATLTIAAGTYRVAGAAASGDLLAAVEGALITQYTAAGLTAVNLEVIGVDATDSTKAEGRLKITHNGAATLAFIGGSGGTPEALWTLGGGAGILGLSEGATTSITTGATVYSDGPAKSTWYPNCRVNRVAPTLGRWVSEIAIEGTDEVDDLPWGEYQEALVLFRSGILGPFMRIEASEDSDWQSEVGLGTTPTWASWEQFCRDLWGEAYAGRAWRIYKTLTATGIGPYQFKSGDPAWRNPIEGTSEASQASESYGLAVRGVRAL